MVTGGLWQAASQRQAGLNASRFLARLRLRPKTQDGKIQDEDFDLTATSFTFQGL